MRNSSYYYLRGDFRASDKCMSYHFKSDHKIGHPKYDEEPLYSLRKQLFALLIQMPVHPFIAKSVTMLAF